MRMSSVWIINFRIVQLCVLWRERQHSNWSWMNFSEIIWAILWLDTPRKVASSCPRRGFSPNMGIAQPDQMGRKRLTTSVWHLGDGFNRFESLHYFIAYNKNGYSRAQIILVVIEYNKCNISYLVLKILRIVLLSYVHNSN
jgi:hypothetical protein